MESVSIYGLDFNFSNNLLLQPKSSNTIADEALLSEIFQPILDELNILMDYYKLGEFDILKKLLTVEKRDTISLEFAKKRNIAKNFLIHDNILNYLNVTLNNFYLSLYYRETYLETERKCKIFQEKANILDDMNKLKKYIKSLNKNEGVLFKAPTITAKLAVLKPQYDIYIKRFGLPRYGVFDSMALGDILLELEEEKRLKEKNKSHCLKT